MPSPNHMTFTVEKESDTGFVAQYIDEATGKILEVHVRRSSDESTTCVNRVTDCADTDSDDDSVSDGHWDSDDMMSDDELYLSEEGPGEDMDTMRDIMAKVESYAMSKFGCDLPGLSVDLREKWGDELVTDGPQGHNELNDMSNGPREPPGQDGTDLK